MTNHRGSSTPAFQRRSDAEFPATTMRCGAIGESRLSPMAATRTSLKTPNWRVCFFPPGARHWLRPDRMTVYGASGLLRAIPNPCPPAMEWQQLAGCCTDSGAGQAGHDGGTKRLQINQAPASMARPQGWLDLIRQDHWRRQPLLGLVLVSTAKLPSTSTQLQKQRTEFTWPNLFARY